MFESLEHATHRKLKHKLISMRRFQGLLLALLQPQAVYAFVGGCVICSSMSRGTVRRSYLSLHNCMLCQATYT